MRWKTQINENAKVPAFWAELPEADHNEIVGWESAAVAGQLHGGVPGGRGPASARAPAGGDDRGADRGRGGRARCGSRARASNRVERVLSLVLLGDLVSVYLAVLRGIDPTPVPVIERLKAELAREEVA